MPWETPPPLPAPNTQISEQHVKIAQNMLYIAWMAILGDHNIKKITFENFDG